MTMSVITKQNTTQATSNTIAAAAPATITNGNLLVAYVSKNTTGAPTTVPSGWTAITLTGGAYRSGFVAAKTTTSNLSSGGSRGFYFKVASSESGSYTWGVASGTPTWDVTIWNLSAFAGQKPGGNHVQAFMFGVAIDVTRSTNTLISDTPIMADYVWDRYMMLVGISQAVAATTTNLSALSGSLTQDSYNAQTGLSTITGHEYVDMTSNPYIGTRQCTTDQATGGSGGCMLLIADPSSLSAPVNKRHLRRRYSKNRVAA